MITPEAPGKDLARYATFHPAHLELRDDTPLEVFRAALGRIKELKERAVHNQGASPLWCVGDAYAFAKARGFLTSKAFTRLAFADKAGYDIQVITNAATVARRYKPKQRHPELTFAHHKAAAALDEAERKALLQKASKERISAQSLRPMVRRMRRVATAREGGDVSGGAGAMVCPHCEGTGMLNKHDR